MYDFAKCKEKTMKFNKNLLLAFTSIVPLAFTAVQGSNREDIPMAQAPMAQSHVYKLASLLCDKNKEVRELKKTQQEILDDYTALKKGKDAAVAREKELEKKLREKEACILSLREENAQLRGLTAQPMEKNVVVRELI